MERIYLDLNLPASLTNDQGAGKTLLTGIRPVRHDPDQVYITAFYTSTVPGTPIKSYVFKGKLMETGVTKSWHALAFPGATNTSLYGPNNGVDDDTVHVVGNYSLAGAGGTPVGCLFQGTLNGKGKWTPLVPQSLTRKKVRGTIAHSTMGRLVVGGFNTHKVDGRAFVYNMKTRKYTEIKNKQARSITAYGVWHDHGDEYRIAGGYAYRGRGAGYVVRYNAKRGEFYDWTDFSYQDGPTKALVTHFDGISASDDGRTYTLTGSGVDASGREMAFFTVLKTDDQGSFLPKAAWEPITVPGSTGTSGNSVTGSTIIGVYSNGNKESGYVSVLL